MELGHDQQSPVQRIDQGVHPSLELEVGFEDGSDSAASEERLNEGGCLGRGESVLGTAAFDDRVEFFELAHQDFFFVYFCFYFHVLKFASLNPSLSHFLNFNCCLFH